MLQIWRIHVHNYLVKRKCNGSFFLYEFKYCLCTFSSIDSYVFFLQLVTLLVCIQPLTDIADDITP